MLLYQILSSFYLFLFYPLFAAGATYFFLDEKAGKKSRTERSFNRTGHTPGPPFCSGHRSPDFRPYSNH